MLRGHPPNPLYRITSLVTGLNIAAKDSKSRVVSLSEGWYSGVADVNTKTGEKGFSYTDTSDQPGTPSKKYFFSYGNNDCELSRVVDNTRDRPATIDYDKALCDDLRKVINDNAGLKQQCDELATRISNTFNKFSEQFKKQQLSVTDLASSALTQGFYQLKICDEYANKSSKVSSSGHKVESKTSK